MLTRSCQQEEDYYMPLDILWGGMPGPTRKVVATGSDGPQKTGRKYNYSTQVKTHLISCT